MNCMEADSTLAEAEASGLSRSVVENKRHNELDSVGDKQVEGRKLCCDVALH